MLYWLPPGLPKNSQGNMLHIYVLGLFALWQKLILKWMCCKGMKRFQDRWFLSTRQCNWISQQSKPNDLTLNPIWWSFKDFIKFSICWPSWWWWRGKLWSAATKGHFLQTSQPPPVNTDEQPRLFMILLPRLGSLNVYYHSHLLSGGGGLACVCVCLTPPRENNPIKSLPFFHQSERHKPKWQLRSLFPDEQMCLTPTASLNSASVDSRHILRAGRLCLVHVVDICIRRQMHQCVLFFCLEVGISAELRRREEQLIGGGAGRTAAPSHLIVGMRKWV